jgi:diguanylate cyclase (GGDEF)-like protein
MDLDRFKDVNDTLGHQLGDTLLHQVGMRLRSMLLPSDIVARLGGDEFGILLPGLSTKDDVKSVVKKLQDFLQAPFMIDSVPIAVEASIGIALSTGQTIDANSLLQKADIAMYQAKKMANGFTVYVPETDPHSPERLGLMAQLRDAISQNQLLLNFQPQVDIKNGQISGTVALVRWQHPSRGLIPPDNFITTAEHTGLVGPLTHWILTNALNYTRQSNLEGINLKVSVNLSARSLHDPRLPQIIEDALKNSGIEPRQLVLEITESAIVLDPKRAEENLVILSGMGLWLSIDDFGTGYTSLASISRQPINEVKIDKSFVLGMLKNKNDAMIVQTVIELGHNFGLSVVAEGVESKEVYDALELLGCDKAQGYYISKPQAYEPLKNWFLTSPWKLNTKK